MLLAFKNKWHRGCKLYEHRCLPQCILGAERSFTVDVLRRWVPRLIWSIRESCATRGSDCSLSRSNFSLAEVWRARIAATIPLGCPPTGFVLILTVVEQGWMAPVLAVKCASPVAWPVLRRLAGLAGVWLSCVSVRTVSATLMPLCFSSPPRWLSLSACCNDKHEYTKLYQIVRRKLLNLQTSWRTLL